MMRILGIDILSGSPDSKSQPRYSAVLLEDGKVISREELTRIRLLRSLRSLNLDRIACDNLFELFPKEKIKRFFFLLPSKTQLIQVNGTPENMEPLHVLAKRNGIPLTSRATSMEEAEACARLAHMNVGYEVKAFEDQSRIIVSRARSMGKGGQSQDRYRRKVHSMVALNIKQIKEILDEMKVKYSLRTVKADYGYSRGEFIVDMPREKLNKIKSRKGPDVQVKILPVEKGRLSFEPLGSEDKDVIVGIDPGTTTGIAVLTLDGDLAEVFSRRDFSYSEAVSYLSKYKAAVIIATDVNPAPKFVSKISSSLSTVLFIPPYSMSVDEKIGLVYEKFSKDTYRNAHERDALAAAIKAYNSWKNKLEHVDKKLQEMNLQKLSKEVKRLVIKGESVDNAIKKLTQIEEEEEEAEKPVIGATDEYKGIIRSLKAEIKVLKSERENLLKKLEVKEKKLQKLENLISEIKRGEYRKLRREKEIKLMERRIADLRAKLREERERRIDFEKKLRIVQNLEFSSDVALIKVIPHFTREEVLRIKNDFREGDILYIRDSSGGGRSAAEELLKLKPKCLITDKGRMSHFAKEVLRTIPVLDPAKLDIKLINGFGITERKLLEEEIAREKDLIELREAARKEEWLETFISEYRERRRKEIK